MHKYQILITSILLFSILNSCSKDDTLQIESISEKDVTDVTKVDLTKTKNNTTLSKAFNSPPFLGETFMWGVNGHTMTGPEYRGDTSWTSEQLDILEEHQIGYYRINIKTDENGRFTIFGSDEARWDHLVQEANQKGISIVPLFQLADYNDDWSLEEAYNSGYRKGSGFARFYGNYIDYYNISNEKDISTRNSGDGSQINHYDNTKIRRLIEFSRGMIKGIKEQDSNAITIINSGLRRPWGYFQAYKSYDVLPDIIGLNWYSGSLNRPYQDGSVDILSELHNRFPDKPLIFTEINRQNGALDDTDNEQQKRIKSYIDDLDNRPYVQGFYLYELYDSLHRIDGSCGDDPNDDNQCNESETAYGLITFDRSIGEIVNYKESSRTYKFKIEESKKGFEDYVNDIYEFGNQRPAHNEELNYWANRIKETSNINNVITDFLPLETYKIFVEQQFEHLLDREGTQQSINWWVEQMQQGLSRENVIKEICSGPEFWSNSGSNNSDFLEQLYIKINNRPTATQSERNYWINRLNSKPRYVIVREIINSREARLNFIRNQFNKILRREVDSEALEYWNDEMSNGIEQQEVINSLFISQEFWSKSIIRGFERRTGNVYYN